MFFPPLGPNRAEGRRQHGFYGRLLAVRNALRASLALHGEESKNKSLWAVRSTERASLGAGGVNKALVPADIEWDSSTTVLVRYESRDACLGPDAWALAVGLGVVDMK